MPDKQVTFLDIPRQGFPARMILNGSVAGSSPAMTVDTDPQFPGWYRVATQSGSVYVGPVNANATQAIAATQTTQAFPPAGVTPVVQVNIQNAPVQHGHSYPRPNKDRTTAALLAFFLGGLGAHRFYLGQGGLGVLYLVFCWTFVPSAIALIDGILFLCMKPEDFAWKYCS